MKEKFIFLFICRIDFEGNDVCLNIIKKGTLGLGHCGFSRVFHAVQSNEDKQFLLYCLVITQLRVLFWNKVMIFPSYFYTKTKDVNVCIKNLHFYFWSYLLFNKRFYVKKKNKKLLFVCSLSSWNTSHI